MLCRKRPRRRERARSPKWERHAGASSAALGVLVVSAPVTKIYGSSKRNHILCTGHGIAGLVYAGSTGGARFRKTFACRECAASARTGSHTSRHAAEGQAEFVAGHSAITAGRPVYGRTCRPHNHERQDCFTERSQC